MSAITRQCVRRLFPSLRIQQSSLRLSARTILSESYKCSDAWNQRLQTQILQKVDPEDFSLKLQDKLDKEGGIAPVDIDIFANKLVKLPKIQMDFAQSLIYRFRHTKAAINTSDSMHYAIIRTLLEIEEYDRLREIMKDKIHYGIFLDKFSANLQMDHYLKKNMFLEAAEVAIDLMQQEDFSDPINRALAWYSCHSLWRNPGDAFVESAAPPEEDVAEDDDEETYIFVNYIENPYYDDHFDISKVSQQLGKTLMMITSDCGNLLERSYHLLGLGLYEKFDNGVALLQKWAESDISDVVSQETLDDFIDKLQNAATSEQPEEPKDAGLMRIEDCYPILTSADKETLIEKYHLVCEKLGTSGKVSKGLDLDSELLQFVKSTAATYEADDIKNQTVLFGKWIEQREELVKEQIQLYKDEALKAEIEKKLEELQETEEKLTFFDHLEDIKLRARLGQKKKDIDDMFATEKLQNWAPRT